MTRSIWATLALLALVAPAMAVEVKQTVFQVSFKHGARDHVVNGGLVPLLPDNTCYTWYLQLDQYLTPIAITERMTLPEAIDWSGADIGGGTSIEEDGLVAVSALELTTDNDGWITHGWCAAAGDPVGMHLIEVSGPDGPLASMPFEVVYPAEYNFDSLYGVNRADRSANNFW